MPRTVSFAALLALPLVKSQICDGVDVRTILTERLNTVSRDPSKCRPGVDTSCQLPVPRLSSSNGDASFAWFGCPAGYELEGSLLAVCAGTSIPWEFNSGNDTVEEQAPFCVECRPGHKRETTNTPMPDEKPKCSPCPAGEYTHEYGATKCWTCPPNGVTCQDGTMQVMPGWWFDSQSEADAKGVRVSANTEMYKCAVEGLTGSCSPGYGKKLLEGVSVLCSLGYKQDSALCGGCADFDSQGPLRYMRNGDSCAECRPLVEVIIITVCLCIAMVLILVYVLAWHNLDVKVGDHSVVYQKLVLSNLQMIGSLGTFKARGTDLFYLIISRPSAAAGGSISGAFFIKCLYGSAPPYQVYLPFIISMASPIVIALLCVLIMVPVSRACDFKRKKERETEIGKPPEFKIMLLTKFSNFAFKLSTIFGGKLIPVCCRAKLSDRDKEVWLQIQREDRKHYLAGVRLRKVLVFLIYALYPSLVAGVMTIFNCELIGGTWYLAADLNQKCNEGYHRYFLPIAIVACVVYCIGIPLALTMLLLFKVEEVHDTTDEEQVGHAHGEASLRVDSKAAMFDANGDIIEREEDETTRRCCQAIKADDDSDSSDSESDDDSDSDDYSSSSDEEEMTATDAFSMWKKKDMARKKARKLAKRLQAAGSGEASGEEDDDDANVWVKRHSVAHDAHFWENIHSGESTWVRPAELGESDGGTDEEETSSDDDENVTNGHPTKEWKRHYHEEHDAYFWQHKGTSKSQWTEPTPEETDAQNTIAQRSRASVGTSIMGGLMQMGKLAKKTKAAAQEAMGASKMGEILAAKLQEDKRKEKEAKRRKRFDIAMLKEARRQQKDQWFYRGDGDGEEYGPYSRKQLRDWFKEGFFGKFDEFYRQCDVEEDVTMALITVLRLATKKKNGCYIPLLRIVKRPVGEYADNGFGRVSDFRKSYGFLLAGYAYDRGQLVIAWEIVIMVRKLMIASIATIARDSYVQITCALALVVMALVLQARFAPYERSKHTTEDGDVEQGSDILNSIETISLLCLVYTQIISVVYLYIESGEVSDPWLSEYPENPWVEGLITTALIVLNATCVLSLSGLLIWAKLAPDHYKACDAERFQCKKASCKEQCTILFKRCNKEGKDQSKEDLPPGWKVVLGRSSSYSYYNAETGETRWDRPTSASSALNLLKPLPEESEESAGNGEDDAGEGGIADAEIEMSSVAHGHGGQEEEEEEEEDEEVSSGRRKKKKKERAMSWLSAKRAAQTSEEKRNPIRSWQNRTNHL